MAAHSAFNFLIYSRAGSLRTSGYLGNRIAKCILEWRNTGRRRASSPMLFAKLMWIYGGFFTHKFNPLLIYPTACLIHKTIMKAVKMGYWWRKAGWTKTKSIKNLIHAYCSSQNTAIKPRNYPQLKHFKPINPENDPINARITVRKEIYCKFESQSML